jgi:hypothetical protein
MCVHVSRLCVMNKQYVLQQPRKQRELPLIFGCVRGVWVVRNVTSLGCQKLITDNELNTLSVKFGRHG